ncbi:hypothetical protein G6F59_013876 [Rhizopus arrhizus]|nr:hypothetical protein G6F59_013876 [Rhizopus arrhizus]
MLSPPIINPPQSAILGMHAIKERPIAQNGQVVIAPMMYLALSYDHRIIDGKDSVQFLVDIKNQLENPGRMLFGLNNSMAEQFDVVVIGAGPAGYHAAIRAAQLGLKTACIDAALGKDGKPALGGTCLRVGCIPSKALLQSSEHFEQANHHFAEHGIEVKGVSLKLDTLIGRKNTVVKQNNDGILYLFKKNKVTFFHGKGAFSGQVEGGWAIKVTGTTEEDLVAKHVGVATGSSARELPGLPFDEKVVLSNDGALNIGAVPKTLGVIGAGVIGLEMGSVWV